MAGERFAASGERVEDFRLRGSVLGAMQSSAATAETVILRSHGARSVTTEENGLRIGPRRMLSRGWFA